MEEKPRFNTFPFESKLTTLPPDIIEFMKLIKALVHS